MKRTLFLASAMLCISTALLAQPEKNVSAYNQLWLGYFNQARFSNRWGSWIDLQLRTKEAFTNSFSQSIIRLGLTYYASENVKLTVGYARVSIYPWDNHPGVTVPEHRPWQQIQWHTKFTRTRLAQWIRLDERFRRKVQNDSTLADGYQFNWRLRYNIWYEVPLIKDGAQTNSLSFIANDELMVNFGKQIVYNYFDQNRLFLGFKFQLGKNTNLQAGYMNMFQQLSSGNSYKNVHAGRLFFYQNLDFRRK